MLDVEREYRTLRSARIEFCHVGAFLSSEAVLVEQLKQRLGIDDLEALEDELEKRVQDWIAGIEDEQLIQHDVKSLVFSQLRSWC